MPDLTESDSAILKEVQKEREKPLSGAEIAKKIEHSPSVVSEGIMRLRVERIISSWAVRLDAKKVGIQIIAFVGVSLRLHDKEVLDEFENVLRDKAKYP